MANIIQIKIDARDIIKAQKALASIPGGFERAMSDAVNRSLLAGRTRISTGIRERYNVSASDIKAETNITRATPTHCAGELHIQGNPLPLEAGSNFNVAQAGVRNPTTRATIIKGSRKVIQGAWLDTSGRATKREGPERYPIERVHTLSVANMAAVPEVIEPTVERAQQVLSDRLASNVLRMIQGKMGGK